MRALLRLFLLSAMAAMAALPVIAGSASADIRTFRVTAEGSATYSRYDDSRSPGVAVGFKREAAVTSRWRMTIPRLSINSLGNLEGFGPFYAPGKLTGGGTDSVVIYGEAGDKIIETPGECVAPNQEVSATGALRRDKNAPPENEVGAHLVFRPFDAIGFDGACTGAAAPGNGVGVWGGDPNAFDQHFFLPKLATDQGKVIVHVDRGSSNGAPCPGMEFATKACKLSWSGKLTFELIEVAPDPLDPDGLVVPIPVDLGSRPGPSELEEIFVPIKPKVSSDGRRASVEIRCRSACAGVVRAYAPGRRAAGSRGPAGASAAASGSRAAPPLASRRFAAPAGRPVTVTLAFRGAARRAVRRAGGVRLLVSVGGKSRSLLAKAGGR